MRQNNKLFIDLLNKVRVGNINNDVGKLLKATFIHEPDKNYPKGALHIYAGNDPSVERNEVVLNDLPWRPLHNRD